MGKLSGILQALNRTIGQDFDPRFDKPGKEVRVGERDKMQNLNLGVVRTNLDAPTVKLSQFEGVPVITSMSDRTAAGGFLESINDVNLNLPVRYRGGQDFMMENPGQVWASAKAPSNQILNLARQVKRDTGQDPIFMPWIMAPSGGDFSTTTGETMISYASSAMSKAEKKELDKAIREFKTTGTWDKKKQRQVGANKTLEGWKGVDDPASIQAWRNAPDVVRKEIKNKIFDKEFRNRGGLGLGEARLAVADPRQLMARDGGVQNIGRVFADQDVTPSDHPSYPYGVPGEGVGTLDQDISVFELMPDLRLGEAQELVADPLNPTQQNLRAMQMGPKAGVISEDVLKALSARGVDVGNIDPRLLPGLVAGGVGAAALMPGDAEAGTNKMATAPVALAVNDFVQRRAEQGSPIALDALEAAATIGSAIAGEVISNASQLGGYLNPFADAQDVRAAGEQLGDRVQYMPSPDNQVLKPVSNWLRQASDAIEPYLPDQQSIDESIPGQMYNALPERAQGIVRSASNLFL